MTFRWPRLTTALASSLLLHAAGLLVLMLLSRSPAAPQPAGHSLNVLLTPLASPAPPSGAPAVAPRAPKKAEPRARGRNDAPARPVVAAPAEPSRRVSPSVTGGPVSAPPVAPASALQDAASYRPTENLLTPPALVGPLQAQYPRQAFEQRRKAVVVLQLMIDESGKVVEALALPGPGEDFVAAALEALGRARFSPGEAAGRPVRARAYFAVSFVIE